MIPHIDLSKYPALCKFADDIEVLIIESEEMRIEIAQAIKDYPILKTIAPNDILKWLKRIW